MATKIISDNAPAQAVSIPGFSVAPGARAMLVTDRGDGTFDVRPIERGESVLNIDRDLLNHLNEYPHSTAWLEELRDYCSARIEARADARRSGSICTPNPHANWDLTCLASLRSGKVVA